MRNALKTFSRSRSQKLEVCYNTPDCEDPVNNVLAGDPDIAADFMHDRCLSNHIVYGHGVRNQGIQNFAEYHNISNSNAAWVAMIREPMALAVSTYKEFHGRGDFNGSFEQWIRDGRADNTYFTEYFVSPSDSGEPLSKRAREWAKSENVLILFNENYSASIHQLAMFLRASPAEESAMKHAAETVLNVRPSQMFNLTLSEAALDILNKDVQPLYDVYNAVLAEKSRARASLPIIRRLGPNSNTVEIQVRLDWRDEEE